MKSYDVEVQLRGESPRIIKTQASNPTVALEIAVNNARRWPAADQDKVISVRLLGSAVSIGSGRIQLVRRGSEAKLAVRDPSNSAINCTE